MPRISLLIAIIGFASLGTASPILIQGTFTQDDTLVEVPFDMAAIGTVMIRTLSFGGGMNASGVLVLGGGFEPVLSLFDASGALIAQDVTGGTAPAGCGVRNIDSLSQFCLDAAISTTLNPGSYTVVLSEFDNVSNGSLASGFSREGDGNFTGPEFRGAAGAFILFDGSQRSNAYALEITGVVPEPNTLTLIIIALSLAAARFGLHALLKLPLIAKGGMVR